LAQDANHFIWAGTAVGVSRTDGRHFTNFTMMDGLAGDKVTSLAVDADNRIWVGHQEAGISIISADTITHLKEADGLANNEVHVLLPAADGSVWVGTFRGLTRFSKDGVKTYGVADGLTSDNVQALAFDDRGRLWIGTFGEGIFLLEGDRIHPFVPPRELTNQHITGLDHNEGGMLIATKDGAFRYDPKTEQLVTVISAVGPVNAVAKQGDALWSGTFNGLARVLKDATLKLSELNGLPNDEVTCLFTDKEGNLWIGTRDGLACLTHAALAYFETGEGRELRAGSLFKDRQGHIWAGNGSGGVFRRVNDRFERAFEDPDINDHMIRPVAEDAEGNLWFGTLDFGGLYQWDGKGIYNYSDAFGMSDNNISSLLLLPSGKMAIGTPGGLSLYSDEAFEVIPLSDSPISDHITTMALLKGPQVLIGSMDGTVSVLNDGEVNQLLSASAIGAPVNHFSDTRSGICISTEGNGLFLFKDGKLRHITMEQGLPDRYVRSACEVMGKLYVGTSKGIFCVELEDVALRVMTVQSSFKGESVECMPGALLQEGGTLWFGTSTGVIRFQPRQFPSSTSAPHLFMEGLDLFYKPVNWLEKGFGTDARGLPMELVLPFNENYLRFHFKAISTTDPERVRYRWKLDGFESDFGPFSAEGVANYPNLPPGSYTLLVEACTGDDACVTQHLSYGFTVRPPFWRTLWFYVLVVVVLMAGTYAYIRWRETRLREEKRVLEDTVQERTRELREQKEIVEEQNRHITESIQYASNIQMAVLPSEEEMKRFFSGHFVLYRPKETVGGDFYWAYQDGQVTWVAAVDCTGHGVSGAFMSMIGTDLLNQIIIEKRVDDPALVLSALDKGIKLAFAQSAREFEGDKGMDICLVRIDRASGSVMFAGAHRPLYVVYAGELTEYEGDQLSITSTNDGHKSFTQHRFQWNPGMRLFLFSDGYADQFGGSKGKKFMTRQLKEIILSCYDRPMTEQKAALEHGLDLWKGTDYPQLDDILIIGVQL
jgi:ligand-binding sensor domain-containing protein/serine phosphatase RsbU (regulator of sigma subunit)